MVLAALWAAVLYLYDRSFFLWNVPVFGPLLLAVPLTVWSSQYQCRPPLPSNRSLSHT